MNATYERPAHRNKQIGIGTDTEDKRYAHEPTQHDGNGSVILLGHVIPCKERKKYAQPHHKKKAESLGIKVTHGKR